MVFENKNHKPMKAALIKNPLTPVRWVAVSSETYQLSTCTCFIWTKNFI